MKPSIFKLFCVGPLSDFVFHDVTKDLLCQDYDVVIELSKARSGHNFPQKTKFIFLSRNRNGIIKLRIDIIKELHSSTLKTTETEEYFLRPQAN